MKIETTPIKDLCVIHRPIRKDERGTFTRLYGADEFALHGMTTRAVHVNTSTSSEKGTLRGIHFQYPPYSEAKIVACTAGAVFDIGVDLRPDSPTRFQWYGQILTPENGVSLLVPEGFGHGFLTLEPNSTVVYVVSEVYAPDSESGIRFDDPVLSIQWPIPPKVISEKDTSWGWINDRMEELEKKFVNQ
jgi:dTDP-4-dehydrorhamnose 3,5-epimerase